MVGHVASSNRLRIWFMAVEITAAYEHSMQRWSRRMRVHARHLPAAKKIILQIESCFVADVSTDKHATSVRDLAPDKTVKLWKIRKKKITKVTYAEPRETRGGLTPSSTKVLALPQISVAGTEVTSSVKRVFGNAHAYHVNSIDPNSDGEHFLSADDMRINLWNLEITDRSFSECIGANQSVTSSLDFAVGVLAVHA